ncbi:hypothetical protein H0E87_017610 [Populus deltoides]|uniref:Uncharacterized protein n=1 Tax=Populus deltoides TaxID=3696 RepID=A0A8T2Y0W4_POPDE|nr:hypothetical protein H0E87_017610 [Populus deltoides]
MKNIFGIVGMDVIMAPGAEAGYLWEKINLEKSIIILLANILLTIDGVPVWYGKIYEATVDILEDSTVGNRCMDQDQQNQKQCLLDQQKFMEVGVYSHAEVGWRERLHGRKQETKR